MRKITIYKRFWYIIGLVFISFSLTIIAPYVSILSKYEEYIQDSKNVGNLFSLISSVLVFAYIQFSIRDKELSDEDNILYNISFLFFLFSILAFRLELAFRVAMYFGFIVPIFFSRIIQNVSVLKKLLCLMFFLYAFTGVPLSVNPYQLYWNEIEIQKNWQTSN